MGGVIETVMISKLEIYKAQIKAHLMIELSIAVASWRNEATWRFVLSACVYVEKNLLDLFGKHQNPA